MKRAVLIGLASVAASGVVGCSSESTPAASSAPATTSVAVASDEEQIRELVEQQEAAMAGYDFTTMAELTCAQYREDVTKLPDTMFPPISDAGTPEELAAKPPETLTTALKTQYPTASDATIGALVDALIRYDEPAYKAANLDVLRETTTVSIDKVENIAVTGDTATADVTSTWKAGNEPPATDTQPNTYRKENGQWLDCEDPSP